MSFHRQHAVRKRGILFKEVLPKQPSLHTYLSIEFDSIHSNFNPLGKILGKMIKLNIHLKKSFAFEKGFLSLALSKF